MKYTHKDFEQELYEIIEIFMQNYDDIFDPDRTKYFLALDYVKKRGIDSQDVFALEKLGDELDKKQMSLLYQMNECLDEFEKQKLKDLFSQLSDIHVGLLSLMINRHEGEFLA